MTQKRVDRFSALLAEQKGLEKLTWLADADVTKVTTFDGGFLCKEQDISRLCRTADSEKRGS